MKERNVMVNIDLLEMQQPPAGLNLRDYPRDTQAVEISPSGPAFRQNVYLKLNGRRYDGSVLAAPRIGGHGGPNAAGPCGHIGTADPDDCNGEISCTVCGENGSWYVPFEFFFTRV